MVIPHGNNMIALLIIACLVIVVLGVIIYIIVDVNADFAKERKARYEITGDLLEELAYMQDKLNVAEGMLEARTKSKKTVKAKPVKEAKKPKKTSKK